MNKKGLTLFLVTFLTFVLLISLQCKAPKGAIEKVDDATLELGKIELGRKLFFDKRLSLDSSISCATCHRPNLAFTDGLQVSEGIYHQKTQRNAPTLLNAKDLKTVMFDAHLNTLELQVIVPIQEPTEMGIEMKVLIERLKKDTSYQNAAKHLYNRNFDPFVLTRSIAAFERSLVSKQSKFDQYLKGKRNAISNTAKLGYQLFKGKANCIECHNGENFTNYLAENNGIKQDYTLDEGRFRIHHDSSDIGKFKVPTLRNIALTGPYMHDGSFLTLEEVIAHYNTGGKSHPNKSSKIKPLHLNKKEQNALKTFLLSLTDTSYMIKFR